MCVGRAQWGETSLHCAAENGHLAVVRLLLNDGARVNAKPGVRALLHDIRALHDVRSAVLTWVLAHRVAGLHCTLLRTMVAWR